VNQIVEKGQTPDATDSAVGTFDLLDSALALEIDEASDESVGAFGSSVEGFGLVGEAFGSLGENFALFC